MTSRQRMSLENTRELMGKGAYATLKGGKLGITLHVVAVDNATYVTCRTIRKSIREKVRIILRMSTACQWFGCSWMKTEGFRTATYVGITEMEITATLTQFLPNPRLATLWALTSMKHSNQTAFGKRCYLMLWAGSPMARTQRLCLTNVEILKKAWHAYG